MSLNELAVDLTCDPVEFEPAFTPPPKAVGPQNMPGALYTEAPEPRTRREPRVKYQVHGGMLRMSKLMGAHGRPVHVAIRDALKNNRGYDLVLCGHSLGAGVAALLGLVRAALLIFKWH
jgi:sn1-specific diacylglycerol lipase